MYADLNVTYTDGNGEEIPEYEPPRTDALYYLRTGINFDKDIPGIPGDRFKLTRRVRLVKTCEQWTYHRGYDGGQESDQCLGGARYRLTSTDGYGQVHDSLVCLDCMLDNLEHAEEWFPDTCTLVRLVDGVIVFGK